MKANILIDEHGNARLADFGLLIFVSDPTNPTVSSSHTPAGTTRWMSPELLDPDRFGPKDGRPTKESDSYALGMVIYEVLSGKFPFASYREYVVMRKVIEGERPGRPEGVEGKWFTDYLWHALQLCWAQEPKRRPTIGEAREYLGPVPKGWKPPPPSTDWRVRDPLRAATSYSPTFSSSNGVDSITPAFAAQDLQSHYQTRRIQSTPSPPPIPQEQTQPRITGEQAIEILKKLGLANLPPGSDLASDAGILGILRRLGSPPSGGGIPFRDDKNIRSSVDTLSPFSRYASRKVFPSPHPSRPPRPHPTTLRAHPIIHELNLRLILILRSHSLRIQVPLLHDTPMIPDTQIIIAAAIATIHDLPLLLCILFL